jgi:hypothetical protein
MTQLIEAPTSNWHAGASDLILGRRNVNAGPGRKAKSEAPLPRTLEMGKGNLPARWKATRITIFDLHLCSIALGLGRTLSLNIPYLDTTNVYNLPSSLWGAQPMIMKFTDTINNGNIFGSQSSHLTLCLYRL